jgi:hypothetical protein
MEMRMFQILGGWVPTIPEADVKLRMRARSFQHAWHAELWESAIPVVPGSDTDEATAPAHPAVAAMVDAVAEPVGAEQTIEKLVGFFRLLLPRMVATYTAHLHAADPVAEGPVMRTLELVVGDAMDGWREGELLLQGLLRTPADAERAAAHHARLEAMALQGGSADGGHGGGRDGR